MRVTDKTVLVTAATNSKSLRTTVPQDIVAQLNLEKGDVVKWLIVEVNGKKLATVRKVESLFRHNCWMIEYIFLIRRMV